MSSFFFAAGCFIAVSGVGVLASAPSSAASAASRAASQASRVRTASLVIPLNEDDLKDPDVGLTFPPLLGVDSPASSPANMRARSRRGTADQFIAKYGAATTSPPANASMHISAGLLRQASMTPPPSFASASPRNAAISMSATGPEKEKEKESLPALVKGTGNDAKSSGSFLLEPKTGSPSDAKSSDFMQMDSKGSMRFDLSRTQTHSEVDSTPGR